MRNYLQGRFDDCIQVYKMLENTHPEKRIRKLAEELRFIAQAPKLKVQSVRLTTMHVNELTVKPCGIATSEGGKEEGKL